VSWLKGGTAEPEEMAVNRQWHVNTEQREEEQEAMFSIPLHSNSRFFWLRYSAFQASCHSLFWNLFFSFN
jgi:hypothetical protein